MASALKTAFAHNGPAVVVVVTAKQELAMPPKIELAQAKGFSPYMMRVILNGRGDEIVELALTNFRMTHALCFGAPPFEGYRWRPPKFGTVPLARARFNSATTSARVFGRPFETTAMYLRCATLEAPRDFT